MHTYIHDDEEITFIQPTKRILGCDEYEYTIIQRTYHCYLEKYQNY